MTWDYTSFLTALQVQKAKGKPSTSKEFRLRKSNSVPLDKPLLQESLLTL